MLKQDIVKEEIDREEIKAVIKPEIAMLGKRLAVLQQKIKEEEIPVIVVFEGWGTAGKGSLIGKTILNLDPRGFEVFAIKEPTEIEKNKPFLNRFWQKIPGKGEIAVFDKSWYYAYNKDKMQHINMFERQAHR